jgi:phenylalanyl-tRNA synthetase beta chain
MKISLSWLSEYVRVPFTPKELDDRLTMLGIEVESIQNFGAKYDKIVVGEVLEAAKHPNADKLSVTKVTIGTGEPLRIVCGAPNVRAGLKVAVATVGTDFGDGFVIKKSKIRGEPSEGMLCSERELGMSEDHNGILELPQDSVVGEPLAKALDKEDVIFEIGITPNRADCLSHIGIAREIAAITNDQIKLPTIKAFASTSEKIATLAKVRIESPELCPRYAARMVKGITVAPSPDWLKRKLEAVGLRPVNNVVDVTNFVLMECGHPLHAFDFSQITNGEIVVRTAAGFVDKFRTLDGKERTLDAATLLISDTKRPLAIAGIMGGENSEIALTTKDVFIESAYFTPSSIRRSAKRLGLSTDASYRFERGTDIENVRYALDRAAELIAELAGGTVVEGVIDEYPNKLTPPVFAFRPERANTLLGTSYTHDEMRDVFRRLNIRFEETTTDPWMLHSPSYRIDLEREEDATEEVARLIGYASIPTSTFGPVPFPIHQQPLHVRDFESQLRTALLALGATECVSSPLISLKEALQFSASPVELLNPLNAEMDRMRTSIAINLLNIAQRNERFGASGQRIFEIGNVFAYATGQNEYATGLGKVTERSELGVLLSGVQEAKSPYNASDVWADIFMLRGFAEQLIGRVGIRDVTFALLESVEAKSLGPWSQASTIFDASQSLVVRSSAGSTIGVLGKLSAGLTKSYDLRAPAFVLLLDQQALFAMARKLRVDGRTMKALPKFPAVERDIAIVLDHTIAAGATLDAIRQNIPTTMLERSYLFDEFRSPEMKSKGERSLGIRLVLRSSDKTLEEAEVDSVMASVLEMLSTKFSARLRT